MSQRNKDNKSKNELSRRERKKEQTKVLILDSAWQLFEEKGYDNVLMEDISELADVSRSTLYNYFPQGKEAIFFAASIRLEQKIRMKIETEVPNNLNGLEEILFRYNKTVQLMLDSPLLIEGQRQFIIYNSPNEKDPKAVDLFLRNDPSTEHKKGEDSSYLFEFYPDILELENSWTSVFKKGIDDGSVRNDMTPRQMTVIMWTIMTGLCDQLHIRKNMFPKYKLAQEVILKHTERMIESLFES